MALEGMGGRVGILGFGMSKFGANNAHQDYTYYAATAYTKALQSAGISPDEIDSAVYGNYSPLFRGQLMGDIYVNETLGLELRPTLRVAAGGATGAATIDAAVTYALSGRSEVVLALGFETCSDTYNFESKEGISEALKAISFSADTVWEESLGFTAASSYAHTVNAFIAEHDGHPNDEEASIIAVNHHNNALLIPEAHCYGHKEYTVETVMASPMIASPFRRAHNCRISEGSAALIFITEKRAKELGVADKVVWITGIGSATDTGIVGLRPTVSEYMSGAVAMKRAYATAGITKPREALGAVEMHDPFAHIVYMAIMEIGLSETWQETSALIKDGFFARDGRLPMNLSGGSIGMGHPIGATNIAQAGWLFNQLTGRAGPSQVDFSDKPHAGALKGMGGPGDAYCYGIVMEY